MGGVGNWESLGITLQAYLMKKEGKRKREGGREGGNRGINGSNRLCECAPYLTIMLTGRSFGMVKAKVIVVAT